MRCFKSVGDAQGFLSSFRPILEHFCPRRDRLQADSIVENVCMTPLVERGKQPANGWVNKHQNMLILILAQVPPIWSSSLSNNLIVPL